jgi:opacity protein-like surface antigen
MKILYKSFFYLILLFLVTISTTSHAYNSSGYSRTVGGMVLGSVQLIDTVPVVDLGIGGGMYFDYRFNERFSIELNAFFTTQNGRGQSAAEGSIEFLAIPTTTFKVYILSQESRFDPYIGIGVGFYSLLEGSVENSSKGFGIGAQIEVGLDYYVTDNLVMGVGGTYRTAGLINQLSGTANATTYIPYTLFGKIGYRF